MDVGSGLTRRSLLRLGMVGAGAVALGPLVGACSSSSSTKGETTTTVAGDPLEKLLVDARAEGELNLVGIPTDPGSYYESVLDGFRAYAEIEPDLQARAGGSAVAIKAVRDEQGEPTQADDIDVGMSHAIELVEENLLASYTPPGWTEIPSAVKDPDGYWTGTYFSLIGVVSIPGLLEGAEAPASLDDLRNLPAGVTVGFPADPRTPDKAGVLSSNEAFATVWTVALANGGDLDDIDPGIDFFAELAESGVFDPRAVSIPENFAGTSIAVSFLNNYEFERARRLLRADRSDGDLQMRFLPDAPRFGNHYAQAVVADSPHPAAARLWLSYLVSDEGARRFLDGQALPMRLADMYTAGEVTDEDLAFITDRGVTVEDLLNIQFPLSSQVAAAHERIDERWGPDVLHE